ncbi:MAG TPA: 50S ribosome-binding GTPase [Syntrophorhabdaceae bacterium]|nr:50S ribosome-binding GTPase [Syntrophorhabdaceae bacterium]HQH43732.1 50S ribosome-binding GTPase [Syntrophorhabdaceae bacterium]HQK46836.1 50S ribosome-binding GTPase [Syntrophorhabdaceae bacterium]
MTMPANLPPDYFEEEKKLRQAKTIDEKIGIIENMLAIIPHHKGTDKLIGSLRARVSKLKEEKEKRPQAQKKSDSLYNIKKDGAGQVLFIGFPNSGKSSVISALSGEPLEIADYPYTTRALQQRMMRYEDIQIQLVDTPAIGDESVSMWFGNMVRKADVIAVTMSLSDALDIEFELILEELKPHMPYLQKTAQRPLIVVNKLDLVGYTRYLEDFERQIDNNYTVVPVSAKNDVNLHQLKDLIFNSLEIIRVYSKIPGKKPDLDAPFVVKKGSNLLDCAGKIHKDFTEKLRYAKLWRKGKLDGMMVSRDFILEDGDIIEFHI